MHAAPILRGRIADISKGGVALVVAGTHPELAVGSGTNIELRLDDARGEWMRGTAVVVRIWPDGLALVFATPPSSMLVRALGELADASHMRRRTLSVVLMDTDSVRREAMATAFRAVGCAVVEASSPLEAVIRLGESSFEPDVIAIADSVPSQGANDLRGFARTNHPRAGLVAIGRDRPLDAIASWISSASLEADLQQRIRNVLSHVLLS